MVIDQKLIFECFFSLVRLSPEVGESDAFSYPFLGHIGSLSESWREITPEPILLKSKYIWM